MKAYYHTRVIATILALAMLIQILPAHVFANTAIGEIATEPMESSADVAILGEVEDLREEDTKHFALTDGSYIAVAYGMPVHYANTDGQWIDIDNSISFNQETNTYQLGRTDAAVAFSGSLSTGTLLTTSKGDTSISMSLLDTSQAVKMIRDMPDADIMGAEEDDTTTQNITATSIPEDDTTTDVADGVADETIATEKTCESDNEETPPEAEAETPPIDQIEGENNDAAITDTDEATLLIPEEGIVYSRAATAQVASNIPSMLSLQENFTWQVEDVIPEKLQTSLVYEEVFPGVDFMYTMFGYNIKEQIVVKSAQNEYRYDFLLALDGLTASMNVDGSVSLKDSSGTTIYSIPVPYMEDSNGIISSDVFFTLNETAQGTVLTVEADATWINNEERTFPIKIDPTLIITSGSALDDIYSVYTMEAAPNDTTLGRQLLYVGAQPGSATNDGRYRTFMHFHTMPTIPKGYEVVEARLSMYQCAYTQRNCAQLPIGVYEVTTDLPSSYANFYNWFAAMTWNNHMPSYDTSNAIDFVMANSTAGYRTWNITELVKKWYTEGTTNTTAALVMMNESAIDTFSYFASAEFYAYASNIPPVMLISYRNANGLESYWSYTPTSAGRAGTGYVNQHTGNLVWVHDDIGFGGTRMPVSIKHIYNSNDANDNTRSMGYGWRTNYGQIVRWDEVSGVDDHYIWEDADGTAHYFMLESGNIYKDEDGLELTFESGGATDNRMYTITDKYGNVSYFDVKGRLREQINNQETASSVTITYTNDSGRYISSITDGVGRKYNFEYDNDLLSRISYVGTGSTELSFVSFGYTETNLTSVTYADGKTTTFNYSSNRLTSAQEPDGYKLAYTYTNGSNKRVSSIRESDGSTNGGILNLEYAHNQTTIRDHNGNVQIVQFNNWGNAITVQDNLGRAEYARYAINGTDDDEIDETSKANQLRVSSKMQNTVANILDNGSFESTTTWTPTDSNKIDRCASWTHYLSVYGKNFLQVRNTSTATAGAQSPSFSVGANETYTFSAYVLTNVPSAYLELVDSSGRSVTSETLPSRSNWNRLDVTYTATTATTLTARLMVVGSGVVFMDGAQIEKAPAPSRYNLVENGDFKYTTHWTSTSGRTTATSVNIEKATAPQLDGNIYKLVGNPAAQNRVSQTILVAGDAGDSFVVSGWALGNSAPLYDHDGEDVATLGDTEFAIVATVNYTDGTNGTFTAQFNPSMNGDEKWQYAAAPISTKSAYSSITVSMVYDYNVNTACFDGIQLFKEEFGTSYTYDVDGNVVSVKNLQSQKTDYTFDANHDLTEAILPSGLVLTYEYDDHHNVILAKSGTTLIYNFTYDTYGNNTSVSITSGGKTLTSTAVYSSDFNRLASTTDAAGNVTSYDYDAQTNILNGVTYPKDTADNKTEYIYDALYRLTSSKKKVDSTNTLLAQYSYGIDENGDTQPDSNFDLLTKVTTGSTTYNFSYEDFSLRSNIHVGAIPLASYYYTNDRNNYLSHLDYGNSDYVQYSYDSYGRVTKQTYEDNDTVTYKYDNTGALAATIDSATGITTAYYYDLTDRLMKTVEAATGYSHSVLYGYNTLNNLTTITDTINGTKYTTEYTYDTDNRVTSVTAGTTQENYVYDGFSRVLQKVTKNGDATVLTESYEYRTLENGTKATGQVAKLTVDAATDIIYDYAYDANGNITSVTCGGQTTSYVYDAANQLIRENNQAAGKTWIWEYDNAGNIVCRKEYSYTTALNPSNPVDTIAYSYGDDDWGDSLTSYDGQPIYSDEIGNVTTDGTWVYSWEHGRQLATMHKTNDSHTSVSLGVEYTYNADGLRTEKSIGSYIPPHYHSFTITTVGATCTEPGYKEHSCNCGYAYRDEHTPALGHNYKVKICTRCGHQLPDFPTPGMPDLPPIVASEEDIPDSEFEELEVPEHDAQAVSSEEGYTEAIRYSYVYTGDKLAQMTIRDQSGSVPVEDILTFAYDASGAPMTVNYNDTTYYYVTNLQGDVVGILDGTGASVVSYTYDAWGKILSTTGSLASTLGSDNPLRYRGYVYDNETGLYYLQSRYYSPEMGRFINADAFASTGQGFIGQNMFAYCNNTPVMLADSSGTAPVHFLCYVRQDTSPGRSYIEDQDDPTVAYQHFGITNISHGGCGVIASYNALISLGDSRSFENVLGYYNNRMILIPGWGLVGLSPATVANYFRDIGYEVILTDAPDLIDAYSRNADASILYYAYPASYAGVRAYGAHFVAYRRSGMNYTGYNTAENGGSFTFTYPSDYGNMGARFYAIGIFIYG